MNSESGVKIAYRCGSCRRIYTKRFAAEECCTKAHINAQDYRATGSVDHVVDVPKENYEDGAMGGLSE